VTAPEADALDVDAVVDAVEAADPRETLDSLVARTLDHADSEFAGAVATFTGRVRRRDDPDDAPTEHLEFERYDAVAEQRMATIREELCDRDGVFDVRMHHRTGVVPAGEDVVFVVVLAGHREEAFETVSDGIDRLKDEVPLFKKEVTVDEAFWRHDRPQ
jgi:molybdopterin synthase catalytic subunit